MRAADGGRTAYVLRAIGRFLLWIPWPFALLFTLSWALLIWDLSSHPAIKPLYPSVWWEWLSNLAHAPLFGTLTLLVAALVLREGDGAWPRPGRARIVRVLACILAYGLIDEWHQSYVPGRDSSLLDVMTDMISASMVLWVVLTLGREDLHPRTLYARLGTGVLLCCASAVVATLS
jgi:VanZ family protein